MQQTLEYWLVIAVARVLAGCRAGWHACLRVFLPGCLIAPWAVCGAWASATLRWRCRSSQPNSAKAFFAPSIGHLGCQLVEFCRMPHYTRENTQRLDSYRRPRALSRRRSTGQRSAGAHRAPRSVGALQLLPLADGPSDGHGHPPPRQSQTRRIRQRHPLYARQSRAPQGRFCARPADGDARGRERSAYSWTPT